MVTQIDHIEIIVQHFDEYVAMFRALGFQELKRTKHHGDSIEFQLPGPNQPIFELHRVSGEENIGVNHIAFQVPDVEAERERLRSHGVEFRGEILDSGVCHQAVFTDPDGNALTLHHRYAPEQ